MAQTKAQVRASRENFAIYLLRGMAAKSLHFIRPHIGAARSRQLATLLYSCIAEIQAKQRERGRK